MKTDKNLTNMLNALTTLRAYDDSASILIRIKMIQELNSQNRMILIDHVL